MLMPAFVHQHIGGAALLEICIATCCETVASPRPWAAPVTTAVFILLDRRGAAAHGGYCAAGEPAGPWKISAAPPTIMFTPSSTPMPTPPSRAGGQEDHGEHQVQEAARQHPAPAGRKSLAVLGRVKDGYDAFRHKESDQNRCQWTGFPAPAGEEQ